MNEHTTGNPPLHPTSPPTTPHHPHTRIRTSSYGSSTTDSLGAAPPSPSHPTTTSEADTPSRATSGAVLEDRQRPLPSIASVYPWDVAYFLYLWISRLLRYLIGALTATEELELGSPLSLSSSRKNGRRGIGDSGGTNGPYSGERGDGRIQGDGAYGIGGTLGGIIRNRVGGGGGSAMPELELVPDSRDRRGGRDGGIGGAIGGVGSNGDRGGDRPSVRSQRETHELDKERKWNTARGETNQNVISSRNHSSRSSNAVGVSSRTAERTDPPLYDTDIEPAFLSAEEYPPEWLMYDPVKGMVVKRIELVVV